MDWLIWRADRAGPGGPGLAIIIDSVKWLPKHSWESEILYSGSQVPLRRRILAKMVVIIAFTPETNDGNHFNRVWRPASTDRLLGIIDSVQWLPKHYWESEILYSGIQVPLRRRILAKMVPSSF